MPRWASSSSQSSLAEANVSSAAGSAIVSGSQPEEANSRSRPVRVAPSSPGSVCEAKKGKGWRAPNSSPMKIIGVNSER